MDVYIISKVHESRGFLRKIWHYSMINHTWREIIVGNSIANKLTSSCPPHVTWIVCWLIRCKARVRIPAKTSKRNVKKNIFLAISSQQIPCKSSESKIILPWNLLTYLIGHNNPINGFRPAATLPSRRFCFLHAYVSWLHQSMTGLPRYDLCNGCKVVLFADFRRSPHQIPVSPEHPPPYERHGRASAAAGY